MMSEDFVLRETRAEVSVEWKIKEFFSQIKNPDNFVLSPPFLLSDAKWSLAIYPNGQVKYDYVGYIGLYLLRVYFPSENYRVAFTLGIRNCDGSVHKSLSCEHIFQRKEELPQWGWKRFLPTSDLRNSKNILSPDGSLTIFADARVSTSRIVDVNITETATQASFFKEEEPSESSIKILQENLKDLFLSGRHGDVTIKARGQEFQAHRSILVSRSSVFSAMFDHDTEEKKTGIVNIDDCSSDPFKDFLSFLYTGKLDVVSPINAFELYKIADKYDVKDLRDGCVRCMAEELSEANFCDVVLLATMHNESQLLETATDFFMENAKAIVPSPAWRSLVTDYFTVTNKLLIKLLNRKL